MDSLWVETPGANGHFPISCRIGIGEYSLSFHGPEATRYASPTIWQQEESDIPKTGSPGAVEILATL